MLSEHVIPFIPTLRKKEERVAEPGRAFSSLLTQVGKHSGNADFRSRRVEEFYMSLRAILY
jgi:hypothetical protein